MAKILIIDDEEDIRSLLEIVLSSDGHDVTVANNGSKGIALHRQQPFELIITDIIMPDGDGIDVIVNLNKADDKTPIIAMSGGRRKITDSQFNLSAALAMGVKETLKKPFTEIELRRAVKKALTE
jgi:DNA-binding response OmpR family regulator